MLTNVDSFGQIDSLLRILPKLKGEKKVATLFDLSVLYSANNADKSSFYGNQALKEAIRQKNQKLILESYNILSISYMSAAKYDSVIFLSNKAIKLSNKLQDVLSKGKAYNKIALVNFELGEHQKSIVYNFKALKIFEQEQQVLYQAMTLLNIAISYEKLEMYDLALKQYQLILPIAEKMNAIELFANSYGNMGVLFMRKGNYDLASKNYSSALKYILQLNNSLKLATLYQNMGVNERSRDNSKLGIQYYQKALILYREIQDKNGLGFIYNNLGNCYLDIRSFDLAKKYIDSGFVLGKKLNSLGLIRNSYKSLSRFETLLGNYEKADTYFNSYEKLKDSILNVEKIKVVSEIKSKYDVQKKQKLILEERAKNAEVSKRLYATGGIAFSLGLILLAVWQRAAIRAKRNELETINKLAQERHRIARDLHDNLGAELTVVSSKLDTKIFRTEKNDEKSELEEIAKLTRNAGVVLRETVWSIKSEKLTVLSLKDKLEEFVQRLESRRLLSFDFITTENDVQLTPIIALNFFRISQEAIVNALKYAEAKSITIKIAPTFLEIKDDGKGFDLEIVKRGYGLNNMNFRAHEIGASLKIQSNNKGTSITVLF
jgi:signal transduction histidine kinase